MNMKAAVMAALAAILVVAADGPMLAWRCPTLIERANEQIAGMDQTSERVQRAKTLLAEAGRLHEAGKHDVSVAKVRAALADLR
jgi:hypothetical protein